jgi:hypothetical protein
LTNPLIIDKRELRIVTENEEEKTLDRLSEN